LREDRYEVRTIIINRERKFRFDSYPFSRHVPQECASCMGRDAQSVAELFDPIKLSDRVAGKYG
jgi:hypothetical protein